MEATFEKYFAECCSKAGQKPKGACSPDGIAEPRKAHSIQSPYAKDFY